MERDNRQQWKEPGLLVPVLAVAIVLGLALFFWPAGKKPATPEQEMTPATLPEELKLQGQIEKPQVQYPVPGEGREPEDAGAQPPAAQTPLPVLEESDAFIEEAFRHLYDEQKYGQLFLLQGIIRNMVVTVDNMTASKLPQKYNVMQPPAGQLVVSRDAAGNEFVAPANYDRYQLYVAFVETADIGRFVAFYVRYYPLFQQAYRDLGYPDRYFNDRLVQVIDHLLATPEIRVPIQLLRPKVFYTFANPELEALSAGRKMLIRIGPDHAARVKSRLQELRQALTTLKKKK